MTAVPTAPATATSAPTALAPASASASASAAARPPAATKPKTNPTLRTAPSAGVGGVGAVFVCVNGIPKSYRAVDLRAHFGDTVERFGFATFHFKHRTELDAARELPTATAHRTGDGGGGGGSTNCCLIRLRRASDVPRFFARYHLQRWTNRRGDYYDSQLLGGSAVCRLALPTNPPPLPPALRYAAAAGASGAGPSADTKTAEGAYLTRSERRAKLAQQSLRSALVPPPSAPATSALPAAASASLMIPPAAMPSNAAAAPTAAAAVAPADEPPAPAVGHKRKRFTGRKPVPAPAPAPVPLHAEAVDWDAWFAGDGDGDAGAESAAARVPVRSAASVAARRARTLALVDAELTCPIGLPAGNVGTPTALVLRNIHLLPALVLGKLGLTADGVERYRKQRTFRFAYPQQPAAPRHPNSESRRDRFSETEAEREARWRSAGAQYDDDDEAEEWERHEASNPVMDDGRGNERIGDEPLFEALNVDNPWDKGDASGLVHYTDAQRDALARGDFDEQTADDWDVDVSAYEYGEAARDGPLLDDTGGGDGGGAGGVGRAVWTGHKDWRDDEAREDAIAANAHPTGAAPLHPVDEAGRGAGFVSRNEGGAAWLDAHGHVRPPPAASTTTTNGGSGAVQFRSRTHARVHKQNEVRARRLATASAAAKADEDDDTEAAVPATATAAASTSVTAATAGSAPAAARPARRRFLDGQAVLDGITAARRAATDPEPEQWNTNFAIVAGHRPAGLSHATRPDLVGRDSDSDADADAAAGAGDAFAAVQKGTAGQLMRRMGWREGKGLGRREQGQPTTVQAAHRPTERGGVGYGTPALPSLVPTGTLASANASAPGSASASASASGSATHEASGLIAGAPSSAPYFVQPPQQSLPSALLAPHKQWIALKARRQRHARMREAQRPSRTEDGVDSLAFAPSATALASDDDSEAEADGGECDTAAIDPLLAASLSDPQCARDAADFAERQRRRWVDAQRAAHAPAVSSVYDALYKPVEVVADAARRAASDRQFAAAQARQRMGSFAIP